MSINKESIISHSKTIFIYSLMLAVAAGFLMYNSEKKARTMERETYQEQIRELKAETNKTQKKLETSLLK